MEREKRNLINVLREFNEPKVNKAVVAISEGYEKKISNQEMETLHVEYAIQRLLKKNNFLEQVLMCYGVNIEKLRNRSIYTIMADIDFAENHGIYRIPEKLIGKISQND